MIATDNLNRIWASLLVEECVRQGADTFFLAPGARCTPLTLAVARHAEARSVQHLDERALGYAALGFARATGRPGVIICTSGTAVSNLTPSVVEASMSALPLLLLTADRPFELHDCGANQSIPQADAFTPYTVYQQNLPAPDLSIAPQVLLTTLDEALYRSRNGPVHLNCPFREPLDASPDRTDAEAYLIPVHGWRNSREGYTQSPPPVVDVDPMAITGLKDLFRESPNVLVIAGGGTTEAGAMAIQQLAEQQDWPIISDVTSGLHFGPNQKNVIRHADAWLGSSGFPEFMQPSHVLQFGTRFLSKPLLQALDTMPPLSWVVVSPQAGRFDPAHRVSHRVQADIDRFCLAWHQDALVPTAPGWKQTWNHADARVERIYRENLDRAGHVSEPGVARAITRLIPNLHGLVLGASMPIRDVNQFAYPTGHRVHVAANRGASGIDGTLATAVGFARGLSQPVTVLLGDLAALHDLNSLSLVAESRIPVIVVIVNNHGGGIFHFLPLADESPEFETFFGAPHEWNFEDAASMFSLPYAKVKDQEEFEAAYEEAVSTRRSCVIEVETDRKQNVEQHQALAAMLELPA